MRSASRLLRAPGWTPAAKTFSTSSVSQQVHRLADSSIETFRAEAFAPCVPALLPARCFSHLPAISQWFSSTSDDRQVSLNAQGLTQYTSTLVPLEYTHKTTNQFRHEYGPLSDFIAHACRDDVQRSDYNIYLAQCHIADLPSGMAADVPTPDLVIKTGRGDVYGASIWLGMPPTYTPLHRDPNPNLFVQLAGRKRVRLLPPDAGREVFESVQRRIGEAASSVFRGEEMMSGREREVLDEAVWGGEALYECDVVAGDGLFIPKGWWHSIKSVGKGMHGSVNWWFR